MGSKQEARWLQPELDVGPPILFWDPPKTCVQKSGGPPALYTERVEAEHLKLDRPSLLAKFQNDHFPQ